MEPFKTKIINRIQIESTLYIEYECILPQHISRFLLPLAYIYERGPELARVLQEATFQEFEAILPKPSPFFSLET